MSAFLSILKSPVVFIPGGIALTYSGWEYYRKSQTGGRYVIGNQEGRTYIVTGATSGIGKELTKELAAKNATVIMACRNKNRCLEVRRDIVLKTRNKRVYCRMCNLSDPESVHNFVQKLTKDTTGEFLRIDGIVLNGATKSRNHKQTKEGIELSLATNHMGHFLMVGLFLQKLLEQQGQSRIIFVGTDISTKDSLQLELEKLNEAKYYTNMFKKIKEVLDTEKGKYDMHCAYKFSKLMQLIFARELAELLKNNDKIDVLVADPGGTKSNLNANETSQKFFLTRWCSNLVGALSGARRNPEDAIGSILYALSDPDLKNGTFISSRRKLAEWGANAENNQLRQKVWLMSEKWTKLGEHMDRMEEELGKPRYFANDTEAPIQTEPAGERKEKRSAKYLWLA